MRELLIKLLTLIVIFVSSFIFTTVTSVKAAVLENVSVAGSVGEFYLSVSGFISPFASISMSSNGVFLRSTVADQSGNFSISQVLIKRGFSGFCLLAIDFKRLGESEACFTFDPAETNIVMENIFLPPTIGVQRKQISAGSDAVVFGYSMPGAKVIIKLQSGKEYITTADSSGFYRLTIPNLAAGTYRLFASAEYNGMVSEPPRRGVEIKALSLTGQAITSLETFWDKLRRFLEELPLGPLWIAIPILIFIFILLKKLWPGKVELLKKLISEKLLHIIPFKRDDKKKKALHHDWMLDNKLN